jgi:hypothetical protein
MEYPVKPLFSVLLLSAVFFAGTFEAQANSCPDLNSQESFGLNLALVEAKAAMPDQANDLQYSISDVKEHPQSAWDKYWYDNQPDYVTFGITIGIPSQGRFPYDPSVSYEVTVDTNCKASAQTMFSIEN